MIKFTKKALYDDLFQGEQVRVLYERLTYQQFSRLLPFFVQAKVVEGEMRMGAEQIGNFYDLLREVVTECCGAATPTGLKTEDGEDITIADVCRYNYFTDLLVNLGVAIYTTSVLQDEQVKNSRGRQGDAPPVQVEVRGTASLEDTTLDGG